MHSAELALLFYYSLNILHFAAHLAFFRIRAEILPQALDVPVFLGTTREFLRSTVGNCWCPAPVCTAIRLGRFTRRYDLSRCTSHLGQL
jgi:hypothetical protein